MLENIKPHYLLVIFISALLMSTSYGCDNSVEHLPYIKTNNIQKIIYYGKEYKDEYAWLRDKSYPIIDDKEIIQFINNEKKQTNQFFSKNQILLNTVFEEIKGRRQKQKTKTYSDNHFTYTSFFVGNNKFQSHFYTDKSTGIKKILLDEQERSVKHKYYKLLNYAISPDKKYLAWVEDVSGDNVGTLYIKSLSDDFLSIKPIERVANSFEWHSDSLSLYYIKINDTGRRNQIKHTHINSMLDNEVVYEESDENYWVGINKSVDGKHIFIKSYTWSNYETYLLTRNITGKHKLKRLIGRETNSSHSINYIDGYFYIYSNHIGNEYALYKSKKLPEPALKWELVVDNEGAGSFTKIIFFKDHFALSKRINGLDKLIVINRKTNERHAIDFGEKTIGLSFYNIRQNQKGSVLRVALESNITPKSIFDYNFVTRKLTRVFTNLIAGYNRNNYVNKQLFVDSHDGVKVPVTVTYSKKFGFNKKNPLYLYVYGAYGEGITPEFPAFALSAIDRGFTYAIVHVRGGDELGSTWHEQGRLKNRKNTFKDFLSVAQYFVDEGLVESGNIFASGESAGGTTIGYAINERPDLFRSVASLVPFVDVLNSLMDSSMVLTSSDWDEYGNPTTQKDVYDYIKSYSPYDNIKKQHYPNIYVTSGLSDHAVGYWEPPKWVARIRDNQTNNSKTLIDFRDGGHVKSGKYESEYQFAKLITFLLINTK